MPLIREADPAREPAREPGRDVGAVLAVRRVSVVGTSLSMVYFTPFRSLVPASAIGVSSAVSAAGSASSSS